MVDLQAVQHVGEWPAARSKIESAVQAVLGDLPRDRPELQTKVAEETTFPGYVMQRVNYFVDDWNRVSAWLFIPEEREEELPAVVCCHQESAFGKDEAAGLEGDKDYAFARRLAEMGFVTIAPDCVTAGERKSAGLLAYDTSRFLQDFKGMSPLGKMLVDHQQAIDVLLDTKTVDPERIGVMGHSLGGTNALLLAAFDERIEVGVSSCGFTRLEDDANPMRWCPEDGFVALPNLRPYAENEEFPWDWEHLIALAAPTPLMVLSSPEDESFPNGASCGEAVKRADRVYRLLGAGDALEHVSHNEGHAMGPAQFGLACAWLERWI
jgi:dienelactone hydrolase